MPELQEAILENVQLMKIPEGFALTAAEATVIAQNADQPNSMHAAFCSLDPALEYLARSIEPINSITVHWTHSTGCWFSSITS